MERNLEQGDIVCNFKREFEPVGSDRYLYRILYFATHSETTEKMVVYEALYEPFGIWVRPFDMFMSEVDREKYPNVKQTYRFEKVNEF